MRVYLRRDGSAKPIVPDGKSLQSYYRRVRSSDLTSSAVTARLCVLAMPLGWANAVRVTKLGGMARVALDPKTPHKRDPWRVHY